eukprot:jgi/Chlat1/1673/Chrsp127S01912
MATAAAAACFSGRMALISDGTPQQRRSSQGFVACDGSGKLSRPKYAEWRSNSYMNDPRAAIRGDEYSQNGRPVSPEESPAAFCDVTTQVCQRPRRIILVRHGESEGNVDEDAYTRIPDSKICLTESGKRQAEEAGRRIRAMIEADGEPNFKVYFYASPYLRSLQTLRGLGAAFERNRIAGVREEPRLREQDFGNFQDRERMRVEKAIRLRYGRFFYRFPDGESAADVYDRVTGFRETLRADIDVGRFRRDECRDVNMNLILVSHGLTLRVFLMRWFKWSVEEFERLTNPTNCSITVMQLGDGGRYSLAVHHTIEELASWGMSQEMIDDQIWQTSASPGDLNHKWPTSGPAFFDRYERKGPAAELQYPVRLPVNRGPLK